MTLRLLISLSLLLFFWQKACAQLAPADVFFNRGAQLYISNNIPAALENVESGLKTYPDDEKLKKLEQLLKQQQQQQNQQQQNQQNQQQNQSSQQKTEEQKREEQKQQAEQKQAEQEKEDQKKQEQQEQPQKQEGEKQEKQDGQPVKPGQMTPEEAKRLLDAQKGDEQLLQLKPQEKPKSRRVKDW